MAQKKNPKMRRRLSADSIRNHRIFRDEAFDLLMSYAISQKFEVDQTYSELMHLFPDFDKFYWQPHRAILIDDPNAARGAQPLNIAHHSLHYALMQTYGQEVSYMPYTTLLIECIASSLDMYFVLTYFNRHGVDHPFVKTRFRNWIFSSERLGLNFTELVNTWTENPFGAFSAMSQEMYELAKISYRRATFRRGRAYSFADKLCEMIKGFEFYGPIATYEVHNFVLYAQSRTRGKKSKTDEQCVRAILKDLRESSSIGDYLSRLDLTHAPAPAQLRRSA